MKTFSSKLFFMLFIIGMIGISSCTEQDLSTLKSPDAQVELRSSTPCGGDTPQSGNNTVTVLATRTAPNGDCCVKVSVSGVIQSGWKLRAAQSFVDENGILYYASPCNALVMTIPEYQESINMPPTQDVQNMVFGTSIYELCFEYQCGTKYLHISIVDGNGQLVHCSYFENPCN